MLASSATEADHEVGEFALDEALYMSIDELVGIVEEFEYFAIVFEELDYLFVETGEVFVVLVFAWIVDCTTIEHIASAIASHIVWYTFFVSETVDFDLKFALWIHL